MNLELVRNSYKFKRKENDMDIEKLLQELICKYGIYESYPQLLQKWKADDLVLKLFQECRKYKTMAIYGAGEHTEYLLNGVPVDMLGNVKFIIDGGGNQLDNYKIPSIMPSEIADGNIDAILISSYAHRHDMEEQLYDLDYSGKIIDLYDYFAINHLYFSCAYYSDTELDYEDIYINRKMYEDSNRTLEEKEFYLQRLIVSYLEIKDFCNAIVYSREYIKSEYQRGSYYSSFLDELLGLLGQIKENLANRRKKDILIYWVDALQVDEIPQTRFLNHMKESSIYFENAFTQMNWTTMTMKTILTGKNIIDDNLYHINIFDAENCRLLRMMDEENMDFKYFGLYRVEEKFADKYKILNYRRADAKPVSRHLWDSLRQLTGTQKRTCHMLHALLETHRPHTNGKCSRYIKCMEDYPNVKDVKEWDDLLYTQYVEGRTYLDEQLSWYNDFLPEDITTIYLSDHGKTGIQPATDSLMHVMFMVHHSSLEPETIQKMYCHTDFCKVIQQILKDDYSFSDVLSGDYVLYQSLDAYAKDVVDIILREFDEEKETGGEILHRIQYRGVRTMTDMYLLTALGEEIYYILPDMKHNLVHDLQYRERIQYLRKLGGTEFIDVFEDPAFAESRRLYEAVGFEHMPEISFGE